MLKHKMLHSVQKKKGFFPILYSIFHPSSNLSLAFQGTVCFKIFKKEPKSNSSICCQLLLTHGVKSWHFYFRTWHCTDSERVTVGLGENKV